MVLLEPGTLPVQLCIFNTMIALSNVGTAFYLQLSVKIDVKISEHVFVCFSHCINKVKN